MKVDTESPTTKRAQEGILELLLANHPLDCPVCDKGGECPLQDQAFSHGPGESRYVEEKRHFEKPIPISDLVLLDRERCILCDRCTRFADEVAGDPLIHFTAARQPDPGDDVPRRAVLVVLLAATRCRSARSARSPRRRTASRPARGTSSEVESTCTTCCGRLPHRRAVEPRRAGALPRRRLRRRQLGLAVRPRPLQLRGDERRRPAHRRRSCAASRRLRRDVVERRPSRPSPPQLSDDARRRRRRSASPSSAAPGARTRTPSRGPSSPTPSASPHRDAQLGDGLPAGVLGLPRATIDETARGADDRPARARPQGGAAGPVPAAAPRGRAAQGQGLEIELVADGTGLTPHGVAQHPRRGRRCRSRRRRRSTTTAIAGPAARRARSSSSPAGPTSPSRPRRRPPRCAPCSRRSLRRLPDAKVLPALRRGNVVGALQLGLRPQPAGLDATGILNAAAAGQHRPARAARRRPADRLPRRRARPPGARRRPRRSSRVDTFLTDVGGDGRRRPAGRRRTARRRARRRTSRAASPTVGQKVTPAGTARADWMIAAELAEPSVTTTLADTLLSVESITDAIAATVPAYAGATRAALDGNRDGVLAVRSAGAAPTPSRRSTVDRAQQLRLPARGVAQAVRPGGRARRTRRRSRRSPARRAAYVHPLDVDRIGVAEGGEVRIDRRRAARSVLPDRRRRRRAVRGIAARAVQRVRPAGASTSTIGDAHRRRSPRRSTDVAASRRLVMLSLALDSAASTVARVCHRVDAADRSIVLLKVARGLRGRPRRHDVHGLVRAQGHRRHAEPRRPEQGRPVRASCRRSPTASSCSSRKTCCPTGPTGSCSGWRRSSRSCRRSSCGR